MTNLKLKLAENVAGVFYVDSTCINCDTCRQLAPAGFRDHGGQSSVYRQPETLEEPNPSKQCDLFAAFIRITRVEQ